MKLQHPFLFCGIIAILTLATACKDKQEPKVYSVANPPAPAPAAMSQGGTPAAMPPGHPAIGGAMSQGGEMPASLPSGHPAMGGAPAMGGGPTPEISSGTIPPHWTMQAPTSMRLASFVVKGEQGATADISLIALNGAAGGTLDNVNRWQSQLGQPDLTAEALAQKAQRLPSPLGEMTVVDLQGLAPGADATKDGRIIAAIVAGEGMTFFFKMRGNAELVGSQKADFLQWIGTVSLGKPKADAPAEPAAAPAQNNAAAAGTPAP